MKLHPEHDAPCELIDIDEVEEHAHLTPGIDGVDEYGFAVGAKLAERDRSKIDSDLIRRMDNKVIRNLANFAQQNPLLNFSNVELVEGPIVPYEPSDAAGIICSFFSTPEEKEAAWDRVTMTIYTRGWYAVTKEPTNKEEAA
jgi:hypothetical protein